MDEPQIREALEKLKEAWDRYPVSQRLQTESVQGIDLYPQYEHLITRIDSLLINPDSESRVARIPLGLWVSYLACVSVKRYIFTAWILSDVIPGFIPKLVDYCESSKQEHPLFVLDRLERLTRRTLVSEILRPEHIEKLVNRRLAKEASENKENAS